MNLKMLSLAALLAALPAGLALAQGAAAPAPAAAPSAPTAAASTGSLGSAVRAACREDRKRLCGDAKGAERRKCVRENADKMSEPCKAALASAKAAGKERQQSFRAACGDDIKSLCKDVKRADGGKRACLESNAEKLSPSCKTQLASMPARKARGEGAKGEGKKE